jgi:hypothetical protein
MIFRGALFGTALSCALAAAAQDVAAAAQDDAVDGGDSKTIEIHATDHAPVLDGQIDEAEWADATIVEDLHQVNPLEYAAPSEKTRVYLLYDKETLYVAARLFDSEPQLINARVLRQNQPIGPDDRFFVQIDTFGNRRSGYLFGVNPNGVRFDGLFQNTNQRQFDWDGIWDAAAGIDDEGWSVEMALPFKTLSFDPSNDSWRMNFTRNVIRRNETIAWASRNRNTDPSTMGHVVGFADLDQGLGLDVVPSISVRRHTGAAVGPSSTDSEPSLDLFYKLTPSLNGALTINTDFSATEVDNRQVNLTRFNLFFPEKRAFFLQDLDIFEFGRIGGQNPGNDFLTNTAASRPTRENGRPFFSRSIGIGADGQPVPLNAGAKLSGRVGRWDVGALAIEQDATATVDATTAIVGRVAANLLAESSLGIIATSGDPASNLDNQLIGADFRYVNSRLPGGRSIEAEAWLERTDTEGLAGDDRAYGVGVRMPSNLGLRAGLGAKRVESNFNPALGFISRTGIQDYTLELGNTWRPRGSAIQRFYSGLDADRIEYLDTGDVQSQVLSLRALEVETNSRDRFDVRYVRTQEGLSTPFEISPGVVIATGEYTFDEYELGFRTGNQRKLSGELNFRNGDFYDGERLGLNGGVAWRPGKHFRASVQYEFNNVNLPAGDFVTRLARVQLETAFSSTLDWVNLIQYDNISGSVGINSRLRWIPVAGREGFVVLNKNLDDSDRDGHYRTTDTDAAVKFSYTFRF